MSERDISITLDFKYSMLMGSWSMFCTIIMKFRCGRRLQGLNSIFLAAIFRNVYVHTTVHYPCVNNEL